MIHREDNDGIAVLTLRAEMGNAIDVELIEALERALDEAATTAKAVVLTGAGGVFSSGANVVPIARDGSPYIQTFLPRLSALLQRIFVSPQPIVAAIEGDAMTGGCFLAAACDLRVMTTRRANIGIRALGIPLPLTAIEILRGRLAPQAFTELVTVGRTMNGYEAHEAGLVEHTSSSVISEAVGQARRLATIPPPTFGMTKQLLTQPVIERIERNVAYDRQVVAIWSAPQTVAQFRKVAAARQAA